MKKLIVLILLMVPFAAQARFEQLTGDISSMFERMSGYVVSVEGGEIYTDLGSKTNVYPGQVLKVYRESEEIVHPITGQVLGKKKSHVCDAVVKSVYEEYSVLAVTNREGNPKAGDLAVFNPPVPLALKMINVPTRLELLIKEDVSRISNITLDDSAAVVLTIVQNENGGVEYKAVNTANGYVISSGFYSDVDTGGEGKVTRDSLSSETIDKEYNSMTVGRLLDKDNIYIAVSTNSVVDFYLFSGKAFEKKAELKMDTKYIISIDSADLNGNGVEEIFVSWLQYGKFAKTNVYEYDGSSFALKADKLPFFARVTYHKGEKVVLTQRMTTEGDFIGLIHKLDYYNGGYSKEDSVDGSSGKSLFGFGYADFDGNGTDELIYLNSDFNLIVESEGRRLFKSSEKFGQTPKYFLTEVEERTKGFANTENDDDIFETMEKRTYVVGRIFVNRDGKVYVVKNITMSSVLPNTFSYRGSVFSVYNWAGKSLSRVWESDAKEPVIVDYYMLEEFGRTYLFMLRNISGGFFKSVTSQIEYIETK